MLHGFVVLGDKVLEMNTSNLSHCHVTVTMQDDLQQPHQMLWSVLELKVSPCYLLLTPTIDTGK
jgi:hypothetical protein